jgi:uncharacterized membrane protein
MKNLEVLAQEGKINRHANLRDKQSVIINAPIDKVWSVLTDLKNWSNWNSDIDWVEFDQLEKGKSFRWKIKGSTITSKITALNEPELISWMGSYMGIKAIHVWRLDRTDGNQTIVTNEESMEGFLTLFFGHRKLHETLISWLNQLKKEVEK